MQEPLNKRAFRDILIWNGCSQAWTKEYGLNKRLIVNSNIETNQIKEIIKRYKEEKGESLNDLWVDQKTGSVFSSSENYFNWPHEFSFLNTKKDFTKNPLTGLHFVRKKYSYLFNREFSYNSEVITDLKAEDALQYKNSRVLILGAGPTLDERFEDLDLDDYDFVWSCTKFFLNSKIKEVELDLFSIGGNVELDDPALLNYMKKNSNTKYGIECFVQPFKTEEELTEFRDTHGSDRGFTFHTRYFSKLGAGPRLLALAAILQAGEVHFLGVDGHPVGQKHSFETSKEYKTIKKDGAEEAPTRKGSEDAYRRQFCLLWQYLLTFHNTEFTNLGQGHPGNQSSDIFS